MPYFYLFIYLREVVLIPINTVYFRYHMLKTHPNIIAYNMQDTRARSIASRPSQTYGLPFPLGALAEYRPIFNPVETPTNHMVYREHEREHETHDRESERSHSTVPSVATAFSIRIRGKFSRHGDLSLLLSLALPLTVSYCFEAVAPPRGYWVRTLAFARGG